tara:strand:+ start:923 stop:1081 length:159 start_codon:yes stop_codon:yes gene_type:complete
MDFKPRKKKSDKKKEKEARYGKFNKKHIRNRIISEQIIEDKPKPKLSSKKIK